MKESQVDMSLQLRRENGIKEIEKKMFYLRQGEVQCRENIEEERVRVMDWTQFILQNIQSSLCAFTARHSESGP